MKQMKQCQKYSLLKVIGSGCFGYVFEAQNKKTNQKVALKRIEKVSNQLSREYQILLLIKDCQNVVKIKDFFYSRNDQGKLIQNIIFQFVEDNLESLIQRNIKMGTNISQKTIKNYMYQLLNGLNQIHSKNIAHRDLKPENVLLSSDDIIKICDFGSSKIIDSNGKNSPYIVSRYYRAPQLSLCITKYNTSIDIWAAGCIMAELFLLSPIFKGKSQGDQLFAIFKILGSFTDLEKKQFQLRVPFSSQVFNRFGVYERQNLQELFSMVSQKQNFIDLILKMLCYLPENRITAKEALKHPYFAEFRPQQANNYHPIVNLQDDTTEHLELKREGDD